jgi:hypothetical protein
MPRRKNEPRSPIRPLSGLGGVEVAVEVGVVLGFARVVRRHAERAVRVGHVVRDDPELLDDLVERQVTADRVDRPRRLLDDHPVDAAAAVRDVTGRVGVAERRRHPPAVAALPPIDLAGEVGRGEPGRLHRDPRLRPRRPRGGPGRGELGEQCDCGGEQEPGGAGHGGAS